MGENQLTLHGVSKHFGGVNVLEDVTFGVKKGSRHALIGPNGAGKTTLFNLISGVFPIDAGTITFEGQDLALVLSRSRIGLGMARSFQNIRLMPHLSVIENVMLGQHSTADLFGLMKPTGWLGKSRERQQVIETLNAFGLDTYSGEIVESLPYGVRKKIEVVRALVSRPRLLMLDEPAAGLNPIETEALSQFLMGVSESGVTLLVVEHDMPFVNGLCEHVTVLNFGRRIFDGPTMQAREDEAVLEAYLGRKHAGSQTHAA